MHRCIYTRAPSHHRSLEHSSYQNRIRLLHNMANCTAASTHELHRTASYHIRHPGVWQDWPLHHHTNILTCLGSAQQLGDSNMHFMWHHRCQMNIYLTTPSMVHFQQHPQHVHGQPFSRTAERKKHIGTAPLELLLHLSIFQLQHSQHLRCHPPPIHLQRS